MSWFEDFDEWFKKWRRFVEEFEREVEKEFEEAFKPFSEEQSRGGRRSKGNVYYYGFEITMGPDGKPKIREFGNVKPWGRPLVSEDTEPLTDVYDEGDVIKVIMDMPGVDKDDININVEPDGKTLIVEAKGSDRSYRKELTLPAEVDPSKAKAMYKNGVLTIELPKRNRGNKGTKIKVE